MMSELSVEQTPQRPKTHLLEQHRQSLLTIREVSNDLIEQVEELLSDEKGSQEAEPVLSPMDDFITRFENDPVWDEIVKRINQGREELEAQFDPEVK